LIVWDGLPCGQRNFSAAWSTRAHNLGKKFPEGIMQPIPEDSDTTNVGGVLTCQLANVIRLLLLGHLPFLIAAE
jgi:hypothetical protein